MVIQENKLTLRERSLVLFDVERRLFALPTDEVSEIIAMVTLSHPPGLPSILEGILNLRGRAVVVIRMAAVLGLPDQSIHAYTPLIVLRQKPAMALMVRQVSRIWTPPAGSLLPLEDKTSFNRCTEASIPVESGVAHLISVERILLERERSVIAELQGLESKRLLDLERVKS